MFGHPDDSDQNNMQDNPQADGMLTQHDGDMSNPTPPPMVDDGQGSNHQDNDAPGDYIMTDPQPTSGAPTQDHAAPVTVPAHTALDDLVDIKQKALQQLSPLVGHLEQTPEEKFRTTMMMIQASDDQSLLKVAYDAASQISDEKMRAQALLDVVNEINYFTQQQEA